MKIYCAVCKNYTDSINETIVGMKTCFALTAICSVCNRKKSKNVTREFAENFNKGVIIETLSGTLKSELEKKSRKYAI